LDKKYQVFVSATYEDLIEERREVLNGILQAGCFPASMELLSASDMPPWNKLEKNIRDCDYFVVVSAGKYGWNFNEEDKISYTEKEFDFALDIGKPILAFIHRNPRSVKLKADGTPDMAYVEEAGSELSNKLAAFHAKLRNKRMIATWANKEGLKNEVYGALMVKVNEEKDPSKGWIRASETPVADPELVEKLKEIQKSVNTVEAENTRLNGLLEANRKQISELEEKNARDEKASKDKIRLLKEEKAQLNGLLEENEKQIKELKGLLEGHEKRIKELMEIIAGNERVADITDPPPQKGSVISFGGYDWRVLDIQDNKALLLSERVIEKKRYHSNEEVTWSESELHDYLNKKFYNKFSPQDKARIAKTEVKTSNNPWFGTVGGDTTNDMIFLLSIEEVVQYFGDSGQLTNRNPDSQWYINDQYNSERLAYDDDGTASWWWLRSPGGPSRRAAFVDADGILDVDGSCVYNGTGGVRPALWLNL